MVYDDINNPQHLFIKLVMSLWLFIQTNYANSISIIKDTDYSRQFTHECNGCWCPDYGVIMSSTAMILTAENVLLCLEREYQEPTACHCREMIWNRDPYVFPQNKKNNSISPAMEFPIPNSQTIYQYIETLPLDLSLYIDGLVQERRNSSASAMELRLSCTKPSICRCRGWNYSVSHQLT